MKEFDSTKFLLGALCKNGHDWSGNHESLRQAKNPYRCVECERESGRRWRASHPDYKKRAYQKNREKILEETKAWSKANRDKRNQMQQRYRELKGTEIKAKRKIYLEANKERIREVQRRHEWLNRERIGVKRKSYPSYKICFRRRRARQRSNHCAPYTLEDLTARRQQFGNCCAYCDKSADSFDHFIAIAHGGTDNMGNLIPACLSCNRSKQASDPYEWYKRRPYYSAHRWERILKILGKSQDNYQQLPFL